MLLFPPPGQSKVSATACMAPCCHWTQIFWKNLLCCQPCKYYVCVNWSALLFMHSWYEPSIIMNIRSYLLYAYEVYWNAHTLASTFLTFLVPLPQLCIHTVCVHLYKLTIYSKFTCCDVWCSVYRSWFDTWFCPRSLLLQERTRSNMFRYICQQRRANYCMCHLPIEGLAWLKRCSQ